MYLPKANSLIRQVQTSKQIESICFLFQSKAKRFFYTENEIKIEQFRSKEKYLLQKNYNKGN